MKKKKVIVIVLTTFVIAIGILLINHTLKASNESLGNEVAAEDTNTDDKSDSPEKDVHKKEEEEKNEKDMKENTDKDIKEKTHNSSNKRDDKEKDEKDEDKNKENDVEKTVEEKDGKKVTTEKESNSRTPSATVKVEKSNSSSTSGSTASKSTSSSNQQKSAPKKKEPVITTKTTTATESIGFKTVNQNDNSLEKGKTKVAQEGKNGTRTITYKETYKDGKLTSKEQVKSEVTKQPVDKIVKVGTKEPASKYVSASHAHSILSGSGMSKSGNTYTLQSVHGLSVKVVVGSNHVTSVYHNPTSYISMNFSKKEWIEMLGNEEGAEQHEYATQVRGEIERAVRAAANAVYGSGTSQANSLYNQMINAGSVFSRSF